MTQADLDKIWNAIVQGQTVSGWGGNKSGEIDALTRLSPHQVWARIGPMAPWQELRPMGAGHS